MFWGLSPALDFQEEYLKHNTIDTEDFNILLIGSCDARHILKTIAQAYRHGRKTIKIHVIEGCLELIARQLILLGIAFENPRQLGLLERTRLFMEIYGNTLLRASSSRYMISKSKYLIKMITDLNYMSEVFPNVSLSNLKYKERDYIEMLLKFWESGYTNKFNICELWDKRLRNYLGVRYDSRFGVFDWDLNMRFKDMGGSTVSGQEFKHFRYTGVAFTWIDTEVSRPNCTLSAGVLTSGEKFIHRGYLGDIVTGPYVAYGLDCEDKEMLAMNNKVHIKRATDITERNIMRMMYEIQNQVVFNPCVTDYNLGTAIFEEPKADMSTDVDTSIPIKLDLPSIELNFVSISFHSPTSLDKYPLKESYSKMFDMMFVSNNFLDRINPGVGNMIKDNGLVVVEGRKLILDMRKDDIKGFSNKIEKFSKDCGCELIGEYEPLKNSFAVLRKN